MVDRGDRRDVRPRTPTFSDTSLPPVPLLSCTWTPGIWRNTSRTLLEPLSSICRCSTTVRAPGCDSTFSSVGVPSQSPVTVTAANSPPSACAVAGAVCACAMPDKPANAAAMAAARRFNGNPARAFSILALAILLFSKRPVEASP
ncbi:hypothetical protein D3C71_1583380 [compost metagenome]